MLRRRVTDEIKKIDILIVRRNMHNFKKTMDKPIGIRQKLIMEYLKHHDNEKVYQKDLEKWLGIRRSTLSGILNTMEKNKIITRIDSNNDARLKEVVLTENAKLKILEVDDTLNDLEQEIVNGISEEDLHTFFKVVDKIKENLNKEEKC